MSSRKLSNKLIISVIAFVAFIGLGLAFISLSKKSELSPFPDNTYLNSPLSLNGEIQFEGRVVSLLGRSSMNSTMIFSILETQSGEPLDLAVVVPNALNPESLIPGQVYRLAARADKGNLIADTLVKF